MFKPCRCHAGVPIAVSLLASIALGGCRATTRPEPIPSTNTTALVLRGNAPFLPGHDELYARSHMWFWREVGQVPRDSTMAPVQGTANLEWLPMPKRQCPTRAASWTLTPEPNLPAEIAFTPADTTLWHSFTCEIADAKAQPVPLPRTTVDSSCYDDLLELVEDLTTGYFDHVMRHWQDYPVPIRCGSHRSGEVDLSACLARAVAIWNEGEHAPWFVRDEEAQWGVRLLHYAGAHMSPTLRVQLTKRDVHGDPVRMNIAVGDDYRTARDTTYVIRGMVHELGHTLLLWGHSRDRNHCLWGAAPPLVCAPSADERKAAHLVRDLPEGLDLKNYCRLSASGSDTASWPPACRPAGRPRRRPPAPGDPPVR